MYLPWINKYTYITQSVISVHVIINMHAMCAKRETSCRLQQTLWICVILYVSIVVALAASYENVNVSEQLMQLWNTALLTLSHWCETLILHNDDGKPLFFITAIDCCMNKSVYYSEMWRHSCGYVYCKLSVIR